MQPICQEIKCEARPEYLIYAVREPLGQPAGPDPYSDETFACVDHVGPLLGHQPEAEDTQDIYWQVRSVEQVDD